MPQLAMQLFEPMGDARNRTSLPPDEIEELVTDAFRREVREALDINHKHNRLRRLKKGDTGYLISNRSELADAVGTDKTMINRIIGPARETSAVNYVERSAFVGRIRNALHLAPLTQMAVRSDRASVHRVLEEMPDNAFAMVADALLGKRRHE